MFKVYVDDIEAKNLDDAIYIFNKKYSTLKITRIYKFDKEYGQYVDVDT